MDKLTKTYQVGKDINVLGKDTPEINLDISKEVTDVYHIIPSCSYIINNSDGTASPLEFTFYLFKVDNSKVNDVTNSTTFVIRYTVNKDLKSITLKSNKFTDSMVPDALSDITSLTIDAYQDGVIATNFNIACVSQRLEGSTGLKGEDGVSYFIVPGTVYFQSDDNGLVNSEDSKEVSIYAYKGNAPIEVQITNLTATNCRATKTSNSTFKIDNIAQQTKSIEVDGKKEEVTVSCESGQVLVSATINGIEYSIIVSFKVDITAYMMSFSLDNKQLSLTFNKYQNDTENSLDTLRNSYSSLLQDAEKISTRVESVELNNKTLTAQYSTFQQTAETIEANVTKALQTANEAKQLASSVLMSAAEILTSVTESSKEYIDQLTSTLRSDMEQTAESVSIKTYRNDIKKAGIIISSDDEGYICLDANTTKVTAGDNEIAVFNSDGSLTAGSLNTLEKGNGHVKVENGLMEVYNPAGYCNIRFGIQGNYMVLQYLDNNGNLLYSLGPDGLTALDISEAKWEEAVVYQLDGHDYYQNIYLIDNGTWSSDKSDTYTYSLFTRAEDDFARTVFMDKVKLDDVQGNPVGKDIVWSDLGITETTTIYKYTAARKNNEYLPDTDAGLTTAEAAKMANGHWFSLKTNLWNESAGDLLLTSRLNGLVEGLYVKASEKVLLCKNKYSTTYYPAYSLDVMDIKPIYLVGESGITSIVSQKISKRTTTILAS